MWNKPPTIDEQTIGTPIAVVGAAQVRYREFDGENTYELKILVIPEPEGDHFARAIRLPEVFSHGETVDEAIANVVEVFWDLARSCLDNGEEIPWLDHSESDRPKGAIERWVLVDVSKPEFSNPNNEKLGRIVEKNPPASDGYEGEEDCTI